jgi:hypothetical protein
LSPYTQNTVETATPLPKTPTSNVSSPHFPMLMCPDPSRRLRWTKIGSMSPTSLRPAPSSCVPLAIHQRREAPPSAPRPVLLPTPSPILFLGRAGPLPGNKSKHHRRPSRPAQTHAPLWPTIVISSQAGPPPIALSFVRPGLPNGRAVVPPAPHSPPQPSAPKLILLSGRRGPPPPVPHGPSPSMSARRHDWWIEDPIAFSLFCLGAFVQKIGSLCYFLLLGQS